LPDGKRAYCSVFVAGAAAMVDLKKGEVVDKFRSAKVRTGSRYRLKAEG
jgi:hypothetical protein